MRRILALSVVLPWLLSGCAHAPVTRGRDPKELLRDTCELGSKIQSVEGSVWLKARSKDASGQFPAQVNVTAPDKLKMEVTNLVGGREALISVEGSKYRIEIPSKKGAVPSSKEGTENWGGIPLRWSTDLFLGRIPCPTSKEATATLNGDGDLVVETPRKDFFIDRMWAGKPWPEALRWESRKDQKISVEFRFDDPEAGTTSPKKWEAKSPQGEVKVRWRDREAKLPKV